MTGFRQQKLATILATALVVGYLQMRPKGQHRPRSRRLDETDTSARRELLKVSIIAILVTEPQAHDSGNHLCVVRGLPGFLLELLQLSTDVFRRVSFKEFSGVVI